MCIYIYINQYYIYMIYIYIHIFVIRCLPCHNWVPGWFAIPGIHPQVEHTVPHLRDVRWLFS